MDVDVSSQAQRGNPAAMSRRAKVAVALLVAFLCLPELALLGFFTSGALLSAPAGDARHVDAVVVLGGDEGMGGRYARGRDLVMAGYSQRLILVYPSAAQIADAEARVPGVEIVDSMPAPGSSGSWGEALAVRERMQAEGLRTVMVVSDPPHMLRLRYTWGSVLRGTGIDYTLVATAPPWWPGWRWWRNPGASDFVGNEVLKLGYYVVRYRFGW
jgi:uncharacterized SAM-binding protein YcdF (DUF218 family)